MKTSFKCMWFSIACLPVVLITPEPYNWLIIGVQVGALLFQVYSISKGD